MAAEHFKGKEAVEHVAEAKAKGLLDSREFHGKELSGRNFSALESAKEMSFLLLLIFIFFETLGYQSLSMLVILGISLTIWNVGKTAFLAWDRLERMHRVVEQERWEIQHHRPQEREELSALYRAKGLEGKLLDEVMDVLMADDERLLKIMVEEELCLQVESQDHPLKLAYGAAFGSSFALAATLLVYSTAPNYLWPFNVLMVAILAAIGAHLTENKRVPAFIWNLSLALLSSLTLYFLSHYLTKAA